MASISCVLASDKSQGSGKRIIINGDEEPIYQRGLAKEELDLYIHGDAVANEGAALFCTPHVFVQNVQSSFFINSHYKFRKLYPSHTYVPGSVF